MSKRLKVSHQTFNEIAGLLEQQGLKLGTNTNELLLEKGDNLVPPIDYRLATIRRDCIVEAVKVYTADKARGNIQEIAENILQYVLYGQKQTA